MSVAFISHPACRLHQMGARHPERPARLAAIEDQLHAAGLYDFLVHHTAPRATMDQLARVHTRGHIERLMARVPAEGLVHLDADTALCPDSCEAALRAAGACVLAVDLVLRGEVRRAFCNVRPPGHHAERDAAMGFCLFNNVAVGAAHALEAHGLERVAILDFDVHLGNGTEDAFRHDDRVLICSTFQYPLYPNLNTASVPGHIVNCALPPGSGRAEFRSAVTAHWLPAIEAFGPQLLFISAGFDAHASDGLADLRLSSADYAWVTEEICRAAGHTAGGRVVSTLEGGYELNALAASAAAHIDALMRT